MKTTKKAISKELEFGLNLILYIKINRQYYIVIT